MNEHYFTVILTKNEGNLRLLAVNIRELLQIQH
ncbi:hypothetical protein GA0116948_101523 [Chitinophaga costaii]|uniref:Uncharacterized protein n=1 Tax=Chitinophaga costaii TaxID=1335309 RepID=A0A1C3ZRI7_9BACT|nr:hypothetical protein GA0116948_101523 [Chitinophaga costaii]